MWSCECTHRSRHRDSATSALWETAVSAESSSMCGGSKQPGCSKRGHVYVQSIAGGCLVA